MVGYKCLWFGVKVKPEKAKGTSSTCPRCGSKLKEYPNRQVECLKCGFKRDRDVTACLNLLKKSDVRVRFTLERPSNVAVKPALTSHIGDEEKLSEQKRESQASAEDLTEPEQVKYALKEEESAVAYLFQVEGKRVVEGKGRWSNVV